MMWKTIANNTDEKNENTLWSIKIGHCIISDNFVKCEPIFTIFALLGRELNFQ